MTLSESVPMGENAATMDENPFSAAAAGSRATVDEPTEPFASASTPRAGIPKTISEALRPALVAVEPLKLNEVSTEPSASATGNPIVPSSSLLERRRSSKGSTGRPEFGITTLKLEELKAAIPPLDQLDDTVRPVVIGQAAAASVISSPVEPESPSQPLVIKERSFSSVKERRPTPFVTKQAWLDDQEDAIDTDDDDEYDEQRSNRSTAATSAASIGDKDEGEQQ